jgi:hypothetical protein
MSRPEAQWDGKFALSYNTNYEDAILSTTQIHPKKSLQLPFKGDFISSVDKALCEFIEYISVSRKQKVKLLTLNNILFLKSH